MLDLTQDRGAMERILKQRDRLLGIAARLIGLVSVALSFLLLAIGDPRPAMLLVAAPCYAVVALGLVRVGGTKALAWPVVVVVAGLAALVVVRLGETGVLDALLGTPAMPSGAVLVAIRLLVAGGIASVGVVLTISLGRMIVLVGAFAATMITVAVLYAGHPADGGLVALSALSGWVGLVLSGAVLSAGLLRAARRVSSIGRAHRSERQASETEAQRRQGARLLHDTVLATLTLLAHSGVGVSREALRRQAGDDARLLRQLRLSASPLSVSGVGGEEHADAGGTMVKSDGLAAIRHRFERLGLDVSWHGAGTVGLRPDRQDAFLLALSECLENVRRHSGVSEAHVTVTDDETTVRALVTDNGVGFEPSAVPAGKLGYRESIVGRLEEAGGTARVFSAQGSGTTVVLEMPR